MAIEQAKELLKAIRTDPKAKELLGDAAEPRSEEEMIRLCAKLAPNLGFDVSEIDIREALAATEQERLNRTAAGVQMVSDEDVANATGGDAVGAFWQGEDAPNGHEMGCLFTYYDFDWQRDNSVWCKSEYYCNEAHISSGCKENGKIVWM